MSRQRRFRRLSVGVASVTFVDVIVYPLIVHVSQAIIKRVLTFLQSTATEGVCGVRAALERSNISDARIYRIVLTCIFSSNKCSPPQGLHNQGHSGKIGRRSSDYSLRLARRRCTGR